MGHVYGHGPSAYRNSISNDANAVSSSMGPKSPPNCQHPRPTSLILKLVFPKIRFFIFFSQNRLLKNISTNYTNFPNFTNYIFNIYKIFSIRVNSCNSWIQKNYTRFCKMVGRSMLRPNMARPEKILYLHL